MRSPASGGGDLWPDRDRPPVALSHLAVPGVVVVDADAHRLPHPFARMTASSQMHAAPRRTHDTGFQVRSWFRQPHAGPRLRDASPRASRLPRCRARGCPGRRRSATLQSPVTGGTLAGACSTGLFSETVRSSCLFCALRDAPRSGGPMPPTPSWKSGVAREPGILGERGSRLSGLGKGSPFRTVP